eukprot:gene22570-28702_t
MAALCAFASGCSTLTGEGTGQNLSIMTYTTDNKDLTGAQCELKNDEGTWTAVTPATVMADFAGAKQSFGTFHHFTQRAVKSRNLNCQFFID